MAGPLTLEQIIHFLLGAPMFGDLDPAELSQIVHILQIRFVRPGHVIFRQGQPGDAWYVVFQGSVEVFSEEPDGGERRLAVNGPSACFGEMAILDGSPRSASARAAEASTVFCFPRADFKELLEAGNLSAYKLVYQMAQVLATRQRQTTARLVEMLRARQDVDLEEDFGPLVHDASRAE
jgi:CRP/FNR family cyclic AMP-dependent transcriptional regulator